MTPNQLTPEQFNGYPPQARQLAVDHLQMLSSLPLAFLPLLLRELIGYDWKFPVERRELDHQLSYLSALKKEDLRREMAAFVDLRLSPELESVDWVNAPAQFSEKLSAHLWATHQVDGFRSASIEYVHKLNAAARPEPLPMARLGIVLIGQGVAQTEYPLFRKLRAQGVYFNNVQPDEAQKALFDIVAARAQAKAIPFGHWYIDGGANERTIPGTTCVSYQSLDGVRRTVLEKMRSMTQTGAGPEALRSSLARMQLDDLGGGGSAEEAVLNRFQVSVLAEGSGTQIFSTTFVQWSAREVLRRAQPVTLLARYAPRQQERSMEQQLAGEPYHPVPDANGALIDADMGAYYTWINQQRLSGSEQSCFLVWFEGHKEALAVGPRLKRGSQESAAIRMEEILGRLV